MEIYSVPEINCASLNEKHIDFYVIEVLFFFFFCYFWCIILEHKIVFFPFLDSQK